MVGAEEQEMFELQFCPGFGPDETVLYEMFMFVRERSGKRIRLDASTLLRLLLGVII